MFRKLIGCLAITALAMAVVACGAANPAAVTAPGVPEVEGLASAAGGNAPPEPEKPVYCGIPVLTKIAGEGDWATVQMEWVDENGKSFLSVCPAPVFTVTPEAKMFVPRYNRSQMTFWGAAGVYDVTATPSGYKPVGLTVYLKY